MGGIWEIVVVGVLVRKSCLGWQKPDLVRVRFLCVLCGGGIGSSWAGRRGREGVARTELEEDSVLSAGEVGARSKEDSWAGARFEESCVDHVGLAPAVLGGAGVGIEGKSVHPWEPVEG